MNYHCEYTELVDPATLKPHPKNANTHPDSQVKQLSEIIQRIGWRLPIVVSKLSGYVVAGHCRRLSGMALGCKVPVDYQDFASETEELDFLMADNIIPEIAEWDKELKLANLDELKLDDITFEVAPLPDHETPDETQERAGRIETVSSCPYNEMLISITTTFEIWESNVKSQLDEISKLEGVKVTYGGKD